MPSLNYDPKDPKFILLGKIFDFTDSKKSLNCLSRAGVKNRVKVMFCIKTLLMAMYFDYTVSGVINELNRSGKLRKFMHVKGEILTASQVYEILSRSSSEQYCKYINSILNMFNKSRRGSFEEFLVDATPSECDFNIDKKYITKEHLDELKLKWAYSSTKGSYIGFKVSVVLNKRTMSPVAVLIHAGSPHDSKIFHEILKELRRRNIIKPKDILYYDKGYFSYKNYLIAVNIFKIVPVIFPQSKFSIDKLKAMISYPLESFNQTDKAEELKSEIKAIGKILINKLKNWKEYKPIRGIIRRFFQSRKRCIRIRQIPFIYYRINEQKHLSMHIINNTSRTTRI